MATVAEIAVEISTKGANKVKTEVKGIAKVGESSAARMKKSFLGTFAAIGTAVIAVKKAVDFAVQAKNAARDAEEINNKFLTVFENIQTEAKLTAKTFAESFGLANSSAEKLLSSTGDLLVGFGFAEKQALDLSTRVNKLAVDLASFTNLEGGSTRASEALTKAILGETESAKSLGIVIRQNTKEFRDQVAQLRKNQGLTEQQAKAILILDQAYAQSGKAIGDFARTQDQLANQERILEERYKQLSETIGSKLTGAFGGLVKAANGWLVIVGAILQVENEAIGAQTRINAQKALFSQLTDEQLQKEKERLSLNFDLLDSELQIYKTLQSEGLGTYDDLIKSLKIQLQVVKEQGTALSLVTKERQKGTEETVKAVEKEAEFLRLRIEARNIEQERVEKAKKVFDLLEPQKIALQDITKELEKQANIQPPPVLDTDVGLIDKLFDLKEISKTATDQLSQGLARAIIQGESLSRVMSNLGKTILQIAIQQAVGFGIGGIFSALGIGSSVNTTSPGVAGPSAIGSVNSVASTGGFGGAQNNTGVVASLKQINNSIQAMNINFMKKQLYAEVYIDGQSFDNRVQSGQNRLDKSGRNVQEIV